MTEITEATPADAAAIALIYNESVHAGFALWDSKEVDAVNRTLWMADRQTCGYPVLVTRDPDGTATGYASYGSFGQNVGYRYSAAVSIYIRADQQGKGLGRRLLAALIDHAQAAGLHALVAAIDAENVGSIRLHEALGFTVNGTLPQVGTKGGTWRDLTYMTRVLNDLPPKD